MRPVIYAVALALAHMASSALADPQPSKTTSPTTSPAPSSTAPSDRATQPAASQNEGENKVVCKKLPPPTGSRIGPRKICKTVADWRRQAQVADDATSEIQKRKGYDGL